LRQGAWLAAHLPDATPTVNPSTGICPPCTASGTTSSARRHPDRRPRRLEVRVGRSV